MTQVWLAVPVVCTFSLTGSAMSQGSSEDY
jgi:hypothetical protein